MRPRNRLVIPLVLAVTTVGTMAALVAACGDDLPPADAPLHDARRDGPPIDAALHDAPPDVPIV